VATVLKRNTNREDAKPKFCLTPSVHLPLSAKNEYIHAQQTVHPMVSIYKCENGQ